jgi:hypothetical protein
MKKLVEQTTIWQYGDTSGGMKPPESTMEMIWQYEDTSGGMKPPQSTMDQQFDTISQYPPARPSVKAIMEAIMEATMEAIDPSLLQGVKEKESSNGHDIGTFSIFHIVNHNIRSDR